MSTEDQNLDLQLSALKKAGCKKVFTDHGISGTRFSRPGLDKVLRTLSAGDTLVVWRLDRLGRSIQKLIELIEMLGKREIQFVSLTEYIDTTSAGGTLIFHIMAALAQFERSLIADRTRAGMLAAKARGQHVGRSRSMTKAQCVRAHQLLAAHSAQFVAQHFQIHPKTLRRSLRHYGLGVRKSSG